MDEERLSEEEIWQLRWKVRDGVADPDEVRRLLRMFCRQVASKKAVSRETLEYLAEAFGDYLDSSTRNIGAALGLAPRRPGRPVGNDAKNKRDTMAAYEVLRLRFDESKSYGNALASAAQKHNMSQASVRDAWSKHSEEAFAMLRLVWIENRRVMTKDDLDRFGEIFRNMTWFVPPGKSPSFLE